MDNPSEKELTNFDKARAAARETVQSIVEIARRTNTPIIIYRNGQIERISPDEYPDGIDVESPNVELKANDLESP